MIILSMIIFLLLVYWQQIISVSVFVFWKSVLLSFWKTLRSHIIVLWFLLLLTSYQQICGFFSSKKFLWLLWSFFFFRSFNVLGIFILCILSFLRFTELINLFWCLSSFGLVIFISSNISSVSLFLSTPHKTLITFLLDFSTMLHIYFIFLFVFTTHFLFIL